MEKVNGTTTIILDFNPEAILLANGEYPRTSPAIDYLLSAKYVVCCDGAADEYMIKTNRLPDMVVGDGDSLSDEAKQRLAERFVKVDEQDNNDQTKAVLRLMDRGVKSVLILGATGKREDHTLGNISLLADYAERGLNVRMITDYGVFIPFIGDAEIILGKDRKVSFFNFGATTISSEGLEYPLYGFSRLWQGTLNKSVADKVTVRSNGTIIAYIPH